jgi:hypothetical protein
MDSANCAIARESYDSTTAVKVLELGDHVDCGSVLPGLRLSVKELFAKAGSPG